MRPSFDRNRAPASKTFKAAPKERPQHAEESANSEREGSRSPVKTRKKQPSPSIATPPTLPAEPTTDDVAPHITADTPLPVATPSKPYYIVMEGDPAWAKPSIVHFSTKVASFVSTAAPPGASLEASDFQTDTPSSTPDARILDKLEKERKSRQIQISESSTSASSATEKLHNKLSFIDRAVQTSHWPPKERGTSAQSQALEEAAGSCSAWEIYDAYITPPLTTTAATLPTSASAAEGSTTSAASLDKSRKRSEHAHHYITRVMQRMLYQNLNPDIPADFKFWEDPADAVRPDEGTLLPLWHFAPTATTKGRAVTALAWNPKHSTLFAAAYGSFDPGKPLTGVVCCHTLSDASQPECQIALSSSVLCLAFHPTLAYLLAIGCLDGSVHVIDISNIANPQIKASSSVDERHKDAVWQVRWLPAPAASPLPLRFHAASSDGSLITWELAASKELLRTEIVQLPKNKAASSATSPVGASSSSLSVANNENPFSPCDVEKIINGAPAAISSMDSHPTNPSTLLIGTQEGDILRYCLDIGVEHGCTEIYSDHVASIYTAQWNSFHPTTFLTASADWTVRIWDSTTPEQALLVFDMGGPVGDAAWSPTSSTVFAAATESGRVLVYDLAHSMEWPLCKQKITQKVKLTKLVFSETAPVLLVGDEKGGITCFKLSPNLRKPPQPPHSTSGKGNGTTGGARRRPPPSTAQSGDALSVSSAAASTGAGVVVTEETSEEKARKATSLQRDHLSKALAVASTCRAAEADWVYIPRPSSRATPPP